MRRQAPSGVGQAANPLPERERFLTVAFLKRPHHVGVATPPGPCAGEHLPDRPTAAEVGQVCIDWSGFELVNIERRQIGCGGRRGAGATPAILVAKRLHDQAHRRDGIGEAPTLGMFPRTGELDRVFREQCKPACAVEHVAGDMVGNEVVAHGMVH